MRLSTIKTWVGWFDDDVTVRHVGQTYNFGVDFKRWLFRERKRNMNENDQLKMRNCREDWEICKKKLVLCLTNPSNIHNKMNESRRAKYDLINNLLKKFDFWDFMGF